MVSNTTLLASQTSINNNQFQANLFLILHRLNLHQATHNTIIINQTSHLSQSSLLFKYPQTLSSFKPNILRLSSIYNSRTLSLETYQNQHIFITKLSRKVRHSNLIINQHTNTHILSNNSLNILNRKYLVVKVSEGVTLNPSLQTFQTLKPCVEQ